MRLVALLCLVAAPALAEATPLDDAVRASWAKAGVTPAPEASNGEFLRRVTLDLAGRVPTRAEVAAYRGDKAALVDRLLLSPDYAEHWADVYEGLLVGRAAKLRADGRSGVHDFLAGVFARNLPFDEMTRRILDASGPVDQRGEAGFVAAHLAGGGSPEAVGGRDGANVPRSRRSSARSATTIRTTSATSRRTSRGSSPSSPAPRPARSTPWGGPARLCRAGAKRSGAQCNRRRSSSSTCRRGRRS